MVTGTFSANILGAEYTTAIEIARKAMAKIYQTERGGDETGSLLQDELVLQVQTHCVVHLQLNSKAVGVGNDVDDEVPQQLSSH